MKLLIVVPSYLPAYQFGGPIQSLHLLAKNLVKNGIDVTVYTTNVGIEKNLRQKEDIDGVRVYYFDYLNIFEYLGTTGWQFSIPLIRALNENIKFFDLLYVLSIWNFPTAAAAYYCRKYKIPYIISPRGQLYEYLIGKKSWKKLPYYAFISKRDITNAKAIHYTSEHELNSVHKRLKLSNKPIVIPNGIDLNEYNNLLNKDVFFDMYPHLRGKNIIVYMGRLNWKKGIELIIKSLPMIIHKNNKIHFVIAGNDENNYKTKLIKELNSLSIGMVDMSNGYDHSEINNNTYVTFTGFLDDTQKKNAMLASKLFVLPSYSENFGMAVVEAMACGLPVIISNNVGIYDHIEKNSAGLICEMSSEDIADKILSLLENSILRESLISNARNVVKEKFDVNMVCELFIEEMNNIKI